ncbi:myosin regulatory light polypeptide 9-like [Neocloeon triangulifer]|uniref:myosin regulatory light polypeptide 9-like n=1 Tax=Neocloeon triangulifer TaxID=2078957 RepID=UPI00286F5C6E|nr:myosin regulatory light polypeptide 9-like [Neocloeon triangulifer]
MADAAVEEQPPPPKEKKKKKSSSVKSNKSATEEAPQLNGESTPLVDEAKPAEVAAESATSKESEPPQEENPATDGGEPVPAEESQPEEQQGGAQENGGEVLESAESAAQEEAPAEAPAPARKKSVKKEADEEEKPAVAVAKPTAKQIAEEEFANAQENKLRELAEGFFLLDWNKDGQIDKVDLQMTFASLGFPDVPDEQIDGMLSEASSPLDIDAFIELMGKKSAELDPEDLLVKALSCWDEDSSGFISEERIRRDLMTWGDIFTEQEVNYALEDAPLYEEPEGIMINYIEFCKILCGSATKSQE